MRLHATQGFRGQIIDLTTGQAVPKVLWFDQESGEIEAYRVDRRGQILRDLNGDYLTYRARGHFVFLPQRPPRRNGPTLRTTRLGAPHCTQCQSLLTLLGDELCPACRARERNQKHRMKAEPMSDFLLQRPCDHPGCARPASWSVADEIEVTPARRGRVLYERGATVGRRFYCTRHYQPPRLLDARGEIIAEDDEAGGMRPQ